MSKYGFVQRAISFGDFFSHTNSAVFFNFLMNYQTGVCQVIFVCGKGVHHRNDHRPLDKPLKYMHLSGYTVSNTLIDSLSFPLGCEEESSSLRSCNPVYVIFRTTFGSSGMFSVHQFNASTSRRLKLQSTSPL